MAYYISSKPLLAFQDASQRNSETDPASNSTAYSVQSPLHPSLSLVAGSSSIASDYGSDNAYEASELGTPGVGRDDSSDVGTDDLALDEDMSNPIDKLVKYGISNIDEGLFMGQNILGQLEGLPRQKVNARYVNNDTQKNKQNGNPYNASLLANKMTGHFSEPGHAKGIGHVRKLSDESVGSDGSSLRGSDMSNYGIPNSSGDGSLDLHGHAEASRTAETLSHTELQFTGNVQVVLPLNQRHKLNRILLTMQQRLGTAKTDMEELRRKSLEMEIKLKSESSGNSCQNLAEETIVQEKDLLQQDLKATKEQWEILSKQYEELEVKSKADVKVLVKEVKSLRNSQKELKKELSQLTKEKIEVEVGYQSASLLM